MSQQIRALDKDSVYKICSGQVIVDLATAVKELIENSLDSKATSIEIKLKEMGTESIEVSDNGSGIDPENYAGIALKHHTSKISDFIDISSVGSFGFRGEALNALCELSGSFFVATKRLVDDVGTILSFDRNGRLVSQKASPKGVGTTVIVEKLFDVLPVRRGELIRSIKKQFQKLLKVIQAYAVISTGVKFVVTDTSKASRQILLATQSSTQLGDNVSSVFGSSFLSTLVPLSLEVTVGSLAVTGRDCGTAVEDGELSMQILDEHENTDSNIHGTVVAVIKGLVSKAGAGVGRSDNDRQFIFCNGRPVDLPRFTKVLNEVWRRYEMKHKPAFIINIEVPAGAIDVNLSPDKREVVLTNESLILENLCVSVDKIYAPSRYTYTVDQSRTGTENHLLQSNLLSYGTISNLSAERKLALEDKRQNETNGMKESVGIEGDKLVANDENPTIMAMANTPSSSQQYLSSYPLAAPVWSTQLESGRLFDYSSSSSSATGKTSSGSDSVCNNKGSDRYGVLKSKQFIWRENDSPSYKGSSGSSSSKRSMKSFVDEEQAQDISSFRKNAELNLLQPSGESKSSEVEFVGGKRDREPDEEEDSYNAYSQESSSGSSVDRTWHFDTSKVISAFATRYNVTDASSQSSLNCEKSAESVGEDGTSEVFLDAFISDPSVRIINKGDFERMQVIGQFNLGFMIALLDEDLYILDQHACDEKYRLFFKFLLIQYTS